MFRNLIIAANLAKSGHNFAPLSLFGPPPLDLSQPPTFKAKPMPKSGAVHRQRMPIRKEREGPAELLAKIRLLFSGGTRECAVYFLTAFFAVCFLLGGLLRSPLVLL